jgi:flagellar biosynthesis regulator FlbT
MDNNIVNNDDFKYIIQDTNCVYFGKELTYAELMEKEDVPFKFKAIINAYVSKDTDLNVKITDHILNMTDKDFSSHIYEQLKMTIRICYKTEKKGLGGKSKVKWVHKACPVKKLKEEYADEIMNGNVIIEDVSISKLALMVISI